MFIRKESRTSKEQFTLDFDGENLALDKIDNITFYLNYMKDSRFYKILADTYALFFFVRELIKATLSGNIYQSQLPQSRLSDQWNATILSFKSEFAKIRNKNILSRMFLLFVYSILILVFSIIFIFRFFLTFVLAAFRNILSYRPVLGYVTQFDSRNVFIFPSLADNDFDQIEATISHEHIHICQVLHRKSIIHPARFNSTFFNSHARPAPSERYFFYLHIFSELEARLHELILSNYRRTGFFPENIRTLIYGLISFRATFKALGKDLVIDILHMLHDAETLSLNDSQSSKIDFDEFISTKCIESIRCKKTTQDWFAIISFINLRHDKVKFMFEVVPIAYSNLLTYYGELDLAAQIRNEIHGPNMFDRYYR